MTQSITPCVARSTWAPVRPDAGFADLYRGFLQEREAKGASPLEIASAVAELASNLVSSARGPDPEAVALVDSHGSVVDAVLRSSVADFKLGDLVMDVLETLAWGVPLVPDSAVDAAFDTLKADRKAVHSSFRYRLAWGCLAWGRFEDVPLWSGVKLLKRPKPGTRDEWDPKAFLKFYASGLNLGLTAADLQPSVDAFFDLIPRLSRLHELPIQAALMTAAAWARHVQSRPFGEGGEVYELWLSTRTGEPYAHGPRVTEPTFPTTPWSWWGDEMAEAVATMTWTGKLYDVHNGRYGVISDGPKLAKVANWAVAGLSGRHHEAMKSHLVRTASGLPFAMKGFKRLESDRSRSAPGPFSLWQTLVAFDLPRPPIKVKDDWITALLDYAGPVAETHRRTACLAALAVLPEGRKRMSESRWWGDSSPGYPVAPGDPVDLAVMEILASAHPTEVAAAAKRGVKAIGRSHEHPCYNAVWLAHIGCVAGGGEPADVGRWLRACVTANSALMPR